MNITRQHARRFLLAHQGLWPPYELQGKPGILDYIRRVGCIQYDPLNIVWQNSDLVLQARVADFRPALLRELLYQERLLLDGFDKLMSIYPAGDWPYFRRWREAVRNGSSPSAQAVRSVLDRVRVELDSRGPLSSLDLDLGEKIDWDWSQSRLARAALESRYFWGELVVHHKVHTRKFYDFAHRLLPAELLAAPDPNESEEQYHDWHVHRRIGGVGLLWNRAGEAWLGMSPIQSKARKAALERLLAAGEIERVQVEGFSEPFYLRTQDMPTLQRLRKVRAPSPEAILMAPLDNLLWDRRLLEQMFGFDYRWEVYVPPEKRRYGYYVLPVLYGDRFIARFEPGKPVKGVLPIKNWWWEADIAPSGEMKFALVQCFRRFLAYLGATRLELAPQPLETANLDWLALSLS